jgi:hypothetical protein
VESASFSHPSVVVVVVVVVEVVGSTVDKKLWNSATTDSASAIGTNTSKVVNTSKVSSVSSR